MDSPLTDLLHAIGAAIGRHPRDRAALDAWQARRLRQLVRHAYDKVPFYRRLYDRAGVHPDRIRGVGDLAALPIVDKADLRACPAADTVARGYDPGRLCEHLTAGSTGEPFAIRKTWLDDQIVGAFRFRAMRDIGMRWGDRHAMVIFPQPGLHGEGLRLGELLARLGLYHQTQIDCTAPEADIIAALDRLRPDIVSGYPAALARVAEWAARTGRAAPRPRLVVTDSESLTPMVRRLLQGVFAAPVFDFYDCWEANLVAWQCPQHDLLHICADAVIVELLHDGQPVAEGDSGQVVITPLFARAAPFIRYRVGDVAVRGPAPCLCGRPYATLQSVLGREAEFFHLPDGRAVHPYRLMWPVWLRPWIGRFQLVQRRPAGFVLQVVPQGTPPTAAEIGAAQADLAPLTAELGITLDIALVEDIPVGPSGKHQQFVPLAAHAQ